MKNENQFLRILVVAFVTSLVTQILSAVLTHVRRSTVFWSPVNLSTLLSSIIMWVSLTIAPILIFAVFYFIGKKPTLIFELKPIMLALLIGNIASFFISSIIHMDFEMTMSVFAILGSMLGLTFSLLPAFFLAALAGLSIGYIRQKKSTLTAEPELS